MEITVLPSLTPSNRSPSPTLFCPQILYYKLKRLASQQTWPVPKAFVYECSLTEAESEVASQIVSSRGATPQLQDQSFQKVKNYSSDSISSRLPARSRATMHRSTSIAHRLRYRLANPQTWRRHYGHLLRQHPLVRDHLRMPCCLLV